MALVAAPLVMHFAANKAGQQVNQAANQGHQLMAAGAQHGQNLMAAGANHGQVLIAAGAQHGHSLITAGGQELNLAAANAAQLTQGLIQDVSKEANLTIAHTASQGHSLMQAAQGHATAVLQQAGQEGQDLLVAAGDQFVVSVDHAANRTEALCAQGAHDFGKNLVFGVLSALRLRPKDELVMAVKEKLKVGRDPFFIMDMIFQQGPGRKPAEILDALAVALESYSLSGFPNRVVFLIQFRFFLYEAEKRGMLDSSWWSWAMKLLRFSEDPRQRLTDKLVYLQDDVDGALRARAIAAQGNTNETVAIVRHIVNLGCDGMVTLPPVTDVAIDKDLFIVSELYDSQTIHTHGHACHAKNGTKINLYVKRGRGHPHVDNNVWKITADGKFHVSSHPDMVLSKKGLPTDPLSDGVEVHLWRQHDAGDWLEKNQLFLFYEGYIALAADPTYVLTVAGDGGNGTAMHLAKRVPQSHPNHKKQLWKAVEA